MIQKLELQLSLGNKLCPKWENEDGKALASSDAKGKTSEIVAKDFGISERTYERIPSHRVLGDRLGLMDLAIDQLVYLKS